MYLCSECNCWGTVAASTVQDSFIEGIVVEDIIVEGTVESIVSGVLLLTSRLAS